MSNDPRHLLRNIDWSFSEEAPVSPAELIEAVRAFSLRMGTSDQSMLLGVELPFSDVLLEYKISQRVSDSDLESETALIRITNPENVLLTGAELLWDLHVRSVDTLTGRFRGLELVRLDKFGLTPPLYRVLLGSWSA